MSGFEPERTMLADTVLPRVRGRASRVVGLRIECEGLAAPVGAACRIDTLDAGSIEAEVVGFDGPRALLMPLGETRGIRRGDPVERLPAPRWTPVGDELLGRVVDALGRPIDDGAPLLGVGRAPLEHVALSALRRLPIREPIRTGVRAIDGLLTMGKGQRLGLFSGSGVGKSVLLGMMARNTSADVNVVALVGERGREVRGFIENDLGPEGLARSVVVVATSDEPALLRVRAPFTATAIAEGFRAAGRDVLLLMDSITRMAIAQREVGLSAGEPAATKGFPPSVFALLPRLLERAGTTPEGTITGLYTVLVEGDDVDEPIADACRSILDGHVWLSRDLAHEGHYPAVDPLTSVSRLMIDVVPPEVLRRAELIKALLARYRAAEDLIRVGAYAPGHDALLDRAVQRKDRIDAFCRQAIQESSTLEATWGAMAEVVDVVDIGDARRTT